MRSLAAALALALLLAGCSGSEDPVPQTHTCPNGTVVDVPANLTETPAAACPPPTPPSVAFGGLPADLRVYKPAAFTWTVLAGDYADGHSMLTMVRVATVSNPDASTLTGPESYGKEIAKREHQNLPANPTAEYMFTAPGTYYLRVYATIQGKGLDAKDYWTPELVVVVADVLPTGNDTTVVHGVGNVAGKLTPDTVNIKLGDGVILKNDDVADHVFEPGTCAQSFAAITVPKMSSSPPLVFKAPGTCTFETDDVTPLTLTVNVGT